MKTATNATRAIARLMLFTCLCAVGCDRDRASATPAARSASTRPERARAEAPRVFPMPRTLLIAQTLQVMHEPTLDVLESGASVIVSGNDIVHVDAHLRVSQRSVFPSYSIHSLHRVDPTGRHVLGYFGVYDTTTRRIRENPRGASFVACDRSASRCLQLDQSTTPWPRVRVVEPFSERELDAFAPRYEAMFPGGDLDDHSVQISIAGAIEGPFIAMYLRVDDAPTIITYDIARHTVLAHGTVYAPPEDIAWADDEGTHLLVTNRDEVALLDARVDGLPARASAPGQPVPDASSRDVLVVENGERRQRFARRTLTALGAPEPLGTIHAYGERGSAVIEGRSVTFKDREGRETARASLAEAFAPTHRAFRVAITPRGLYVLDEDLGLMRVRPGDVDARFTLGVLRGPAVVTAENGAFHIRLPRTVFVVGPHGVAQRPSPNAGDAEAERSPGADSTVRMRGFSATHLPTGEIQLTRAVDGTTLVLECVERQGRAAVVVRRGEDALGVIPNDTPLFMLAGVNGSAVRPVPPAEDAARAAVSDFFGR